MMRMEVHVYADGGVVHDRLCLDSPCRSELI